MQNKTWSIFSNYLVGWGSGWWEGRGEGRKIMRAGKDAGWKMWKKMDFQPRIKEDFMQYPVSFPALQG